MCMPRNSRFCLICLFLYLWLPSSSSSTPDESRETNLTTESYMYVPLAKDDKAGHEPDETEFLQLNQSKQETEIAHDDHSEPEHFFLHSLMEKYGNGLEITFEGFEHLLENIGLGKFLIFDHDVKCHRVNGSGFISLHADHNHTKDHVDTFTAGSCDHLHDHGAHSHDHHETSSEENTLNGGDNDHGGHDHEFDKPGSAEATEKEVPDTKVKRHIIETAKDQCMSPKLILQLFGNDNVVNEDLFTDLCPVLIYQLDRKSCMKDDHKHHHGEGHDEGHFHDDHEHPPAAVSKDSSGFDLSSIPAKVWGFSAIAVAIISLVGLLGVAVIPIMQKVFYNHLLQFLVALAVGALSGDALLHLLPHAIQGGHSDHGHEDHGTQTVGHDLTGVYKGLCGLLAIYFFFIIERTLTIVTDIKRKRKQKHKRAERQRKGNNKVGEKLAGSDRECGEMMMSIHPNKALRGYADEAHSDHCKISFENTTTISHQHGHEHHDHGNHDDEEEEGQSMISHSSHGHGHSHCHDGVPKSVSAIAWMVIMGDGIHNFSDGLAIGAAFSNSITGGFSTAIAVFCHELPHEIGDFAMLLRAGMSAKQAIIYNCLSSILCFFGMLIGVAIGNIHESSLWIFAAVGGMFLYICLVDMLPEMSSVDTKKGENPFKHLFLQLLGMMIGAGIMLTIALHEEQLKTALG